MPKTIINGTSGDDVIFGSSLDEIINGLGGDDFLVGSDGDDDIYGDDGNDLIDGYDGKDDLYGGSGSDTFYFGWYTYSPDHGGERDLIGDFEAQDKIDLSNMRLDPLVPISFADQIEVVDLPGAKSRVLFDYNSDGVHDMGVDIVGAVPVESNFIL